MKYRRIPILIVLGITVIGLVCKILKYLSLSKRRKFTLLFMDNFTQMMRNFFEKGHISNDQYSKCIHDVDAIQAELGNDGIIALYYDPLQGLKTSNYQLLVNIFHEIRFTEGIKYNSIINERLIQMVGTCDDALQRHVGNLDREINDERKRIFNPFSCFGEGVRFIIGLPIELLFWIGLISQSRARSAQVSNLFRFISGIATIVSFIGSIITILLGWNEALELFMKLISSL